jgi:DHA3 family macrolide efflux protein-like MFS transporter
MKAYRSFFIVWSGQVVSILGSSLSWFALGVWIYQKTGSASQFAMAALCTALPQMVVSPFAGVLVDRFNRRWIMVIADGGAAVCTLFMLGLFVSGQIQLWNFYFLIAISAVFNALQLPAYSALVAMIVKTDQLGRANGLIQFGQGLAEIIAPTLAGVMVLAIQVPGILAIDLATFCVAVLTLSIARFDGQDLAPTTKETIRLHTNVFLAELKDGWNSLHRRLELLNLLGFQCSFTFLWSLFGVLVVPMILGFSNPKGLGLVLSLAGTGLLTGSLILSIWGGPKRRLTGILAFELASVLAFCVMGSRPLLFVVISGAFLAHFTLAFVSGLNEAIWQSHVQKELQGRIFALKQSAVKAATLAAYLAAGGLADRVIGPLLLSGGLLASSLGPFFGTGPGRGLAFLFFLIGVVKGVIVLVVYFSPVSRRLETRLGMESRMDAHTA